MTHPSDFTHVEIRADFENPEVRGHGYGARVDCPACGWGRLLPVKGLDGCWDCLTCGRTIRVDAHVVAYPCVHWPEKCPASGEGCESAKGIEVVPTLTHVAARLKKDIG